MKIKTGLFVISSLVTSASISQTKEISETELQTGSDVFFAATMEQSSSLLTVTIKGPDDRWFCAGFGLSMSDADALIYTDGKQGAMHNLEPTDYYLSAQNGNGVNKDANQDWTITSNSVQGGLRVIQATRALNTGDTEDHAISFNDASADIIWAKNSTADHTLSYHGGGNRGVVTLNWQTVDVTPPVLASNGLSPADDEIDVSLGTPLTITFDENVMQGTGSMELRLASNNSLVESFDVTSSVQFSGVQASMTPSSPLSSLTDYYIVIPAGSITDASGNPFQGITGVTDWNFTTMDVASDNTPPGLVSSAFTPADDAIDIDINTALTVNFDEGITAGTGTIDLYNASGVVESFDLSAGGATISGTTVTMTPSVPLNYNTAYYVLISGDAIEDFAGNAYAGYTDTTTWNFTTIEENTSGLSEITLEDAISVSTNGNVIINLESDDIYLIQVIAMDGRIVFEKGNAQGEIIISEEVLQGSPLLIRVANDKGAVSKVILKK